MGHFSYKATDPSGKLVKGVIEAEGERAVVKSLQEMGYIPILVSPAAGRGKGILDHWLRRAASALRQVTSKDVMSFTQDLSTLLNAGLPVDKALAIQIQVTESPKMREVITSLLDHVKSGSYLSDALGKHPGVFSTLYVNMVKAGESGGIVGEVLTRLGTFLEETVELKDFIKSALLYPAFLVFVGGASVIVLLTFVIPKFSMIFSDMGQALPLPTQFLLFVSGSFRDGWFFFLGGAIALFLWMRYYAKTASGRERIDRYKIAMPVTGKLIQSIEVSRFSRTLGTLLNSGIPILQALILSNPVVSNRIMSRHLDRVAEKVKEGDRLSLSLKGVPFFPAFAVQMITIGEETGTLGEMLLRTADNYEKSVKTMVKRFIGLLEPVMILAMGLVVGFIVISMLMAIFSINELPF
jgi:type II secretory pathway component PulF